jgi:2-dehydro-3-deoxygluconokinase
MKRVVTFGELMLRLSAPGYERLFQSPRLDASFGGGEANVAVSLARFGLASAFVSRVPANPIGDAAVAALRAEGVDVSAVSRGGERLGVYFAETGASQRGSLVVYDRAGAAITTVEHLPWPELLRGAAWFHVSGITPALGPRLAEETRAALVAARQAGATVSFDLNFRRKLWSEPQAQAAVRPLMRHVHVLTANEEDLQATLGLPVERSDPERGRLDLDAYRAAAARAVAELGVEKVAITLRESLSASENGWSGLFYDGRTLHRSPRYVLRLVDRIGGGDSFAAGLIYALTDRRPPEAALGFAVAASALKQSIPGDFNRVSVEEVERLAAGDQSGRVRR